MKRSLLILIFCIFIALILFSAAAAVPQSQTESDPSENADILSAFSMFMDLVSSGIESTAAQVPAETEISPTATLEVIDSIADDSVSFLMTENPPTATVEVIPAAASTPQPTAEAPNEAPARQAPADPESVAVSTGIETEDFYNSFKANVKNAGRHSVSFKEKSGKNASKISVDDNIDLQLFYTKQNGSNMIEHIAYTAAYTDQEGRDTARVILSELIETLDDYLGLDLTDGVIDDILELAYNNGSAVVSDLLVYGTAAGGASNAVITIQLYYTGSGYTEEVTSSYSQSAEEDFRDLVEEMKASGVIPQRNGSYHFHEDFQKEWAQINWYQWDYFADAQNVVIAADITWSSATTTPNFAYAGCGFVVRGQDVANHLYASMNMDGKLHFGGLKNGKSLNYGEFSYASHSFKGSAQLVLVVNGDTMTAYIDGSKIGQQENIAFDGEGGLAFLIQSGSNKDYGTRCIFQNVYYYTW